MPPIPIAYFKSQLDDMIAQLSQLVAIESPSTDKAALDRMGAALAGHLHELASEIEFDPQPEAGDHLIARWPGQVGQRDSGFLILCHFDTVHPIGMLAENPVRVKNGRLYGPGAIDMKGSLVQVITALRALRTEKLWPRWPVTLLLTSDEELGSAGSRHLIEALGSQAKLVLCMEPGLPNGELKTQRKGVGNFEVVALGKAAHAGAEPSRGVNAVEEMAHQILALHALSDPARGTTVNVGLVSGGTRTNVVPDECRVAVDVRVETPTEGERMAARVHSLQPKLPGARLSISGQINRPPMPRTPEIAAAYAHARTIGRALGLEIGEGGTGGASDANFVAPTGTPVLDGLGPLGNGAHTRNESLNLASLAPRTALLAGILSEWPDP